MYLSFLSQNDMPFTDSGLLVLGTMRMSTYMSFYGSYNFTPSNQISMDCWSFGEGGGGYLFEPLLIKINHASDRYIYYVVLVLQNQQ